MKNTKKRILIVVDYQYDFVSRKGSLSIAGATKIKDRIQSLIDDEKYEDVIYTFDTHNKSDYEKSEEAKLFPNIHCEFGTKGWSLYKIKPRCGDVIKRLYNNAIKARDMVVNNEFFFVKDKFSIFEGNNKYMNWFFNRYKQEEVEIDICGVAFEVCVKEHAIGLSNAGYNVNVIKEATESITVVGNDQAEKSNKS